MLNLYKYMKNKLDIDKKIKELQKKIIEQIVIMVNSVSEKELRIEKDLENKHVYIKKVTLARVTMKSQTLFSSFNDVLLEDVPFFVLSDILDCCEFYLEHYANQKEYEKKRFISVIKRM